MQPDTPNMYFSLTVDDLVIYDFEPLYYNDIEWIWSLMEVLDRKLPMSAFFQIGYEGERAEFADHEEVIEFIKEKSI